MTGICRSARLICQRAPLLGAPLLSALLLGAIVASGGASLPVSAKSGTAKSVAAGSMETLSGVWVEGRGYDVTYGGTYEACAQRCLQTDKCVMIEFYKPEKKCNMYDNMRPRKTGGSSNVGIRRAPVRTGSATKSDR